MIKEGYKYTNLTFLKIIFDMRNMEKKERQRKVEQESSAL